MAVDINHLGFALCISHNRTHRLLRDSTRFCGEGDLGTITRRGGFRAMLVIRIGAVGCAGVEHEYSMGWFKKKKTVSARKRLNVA